MRRLLTLALLVGSLLCCWAEPAEFVPTDEWQDILPGQSIPPGLDVKMNIYTGEKKARKLQQTEPEDSITVSKSDDSHALTVSAAESLPAALEQPTPGQASKASVDEAARTRQLQHLGTLLQKLHDQSGQSDTDVLKASIAVMGVASARSNVPGSGDSNVSAVTQAQFGKDYDVQDLTNALLSAEELCHGVDNAGDFVTLGGLTAIRSLLESPPPVAVGVDPLAADAVAIAREGGDPLLSFDTLATAVEVQKHTVWLLGTVVQNVRAHQTAAVNAGLIEQVVKTLQSSLHATAFDTGASPAGERYVKQVRSLMAKLLYALSTLLRSNELSQDAFVTDGGLKPLAQIVTAPAMNRSQAGVEYVPKHARQKAVQLLQSLLVDMVINSADAQSWSRPLAQRLATAEWCGNVVTALESASQPLQRPIAESVMDSMLKLVRVQLVSSDEANPDERDLLEEKSSPYVQVPGATVVLDADVLRTFDVPAADNAPSDTDDSLQNRVCRAAFTSTKLHATLTAIESQLDPEDEYDADLAALVSRVRRVQRLLTTVSST